MVWLRYGAEGLSDTGIPHDTHGIFRDIDEWAGYEGQEYCDAMTDGADPFAEIREALEA